MMKTTMETETESNQDQTSEDVAADNPTGVDSRVACDTLLGSIVALDTVLEGASSEQRVEIGSVLWQLGDKIKEVIDQVKAELRTDAVAELGGQTGSITFEGDDIGEASVIVPSATLRVPKGRNVDDLRKQLGDEFDFYFETVTTVKPRKEFEDRVSMQESPLRKQVLLNAVERVEPTPRVLFKRHKLPKKNRV